MGGNQENKEFLRMMAKSVVDDPRYYMGGMRGRYPLGRGVRNEGRSHDFDVFSSDETSTQAINRAQYLLVGLKAILEEDSLVVNPDQPEQE